MKILVAYDGTLNAKDALRYSLYRARFTGGEVQVLQVFNNNVFADYDVLGAEDKARREHAHYLEEAKEIIREVGSGLKVSVFSTDGELEQAILSFSIQEKVDLILVPARYSRLARRSSCRVSVVPRTLSGSKILLVDDETSFVQTLAERLKLRYLEAQVAYSGEQAIALVRKEEPDVLVLDLRMPGMDGMDVLREMKKVYPGTEVIILSGWDNQGVQEEATRLGVFDFLRKPIDIDKLVGRIKEAYWSRVDRPSEVWANAERA